MSEPAPPPRPTPSGAGVAAAIAAATLVAIPIAQQFEGYRGKAYLDPAHILTQCYGETRDIDPAKIYSKDQCAEKLRKRMEADYAPVIARCLPEIVYNPFIFGALIDASYNAGPGRVCQSRMARAIHSGQLITACNGFNDWFTTATDRRTGQHIPLRGLVLRRQFETTVCLKGTA